MTWKEVLFGVSVKKVSLHPYFHKRLPCTQLYLKLLHHLKCSFMQPLWSVISECIFMNDVCVKLLIILVMER